MRIHTLTLNPAIDQTVTLDLLVPGQVHRARAVRQNAGGKGVNVASCLADWGAQPCAHGLLGRDNAAVFDALMAAKDIADHFARVEGATRVNLKLVDRAGTTDINLDGLALGGGEAEAVIDGLCALARPGDLAVLAGSLPPGCAPDIYAQLVARLASQGVRCLLDTSGVPLECALKAPVLPQVVKPNAHELGEALGLDLPDLPAVVAAARALHARGVGLVVISMGEEGALFVADEGTLLARLKVGALASTVGAGDAMVAGIAAALREDAGLERIARLATAFAVAKLGMIGPNLPDLPTVHALADEVTVEPFPQLPTTDLIPTNGTGEDQ